MNIKKLIQSGESQALEFKRDTSSLEPILKTIVAFANTAGGIILIGVEDCGTIVGITEPNKVQDQLSNSISNGIKPQIIPDMHILEYEGKTLIAIQVDHSPGPFYLSSKGESKGVFIRIGSSSHAAASDMIAEMKRITQYPFFDTTPCDATTEKDLDQELIKTTFKNHSIDINTSKLLSLNVLARKGKKILATNGGVILFGKPEIRQQFFPFAEIRCARFAGTTRAEFIDRLEIKGTILEALEEVPKFIRRNTKMAGKFGAMKRRDIPEYPTTALRETLINALVHANYEIQGTRIFVAIYDDKLEIQNPGIMPPGMSLDQFKAGVSRIRNPVLARVFGELDLIEEWGSGYKRICKTCHEGGYPQPLWEELGTVLRVTYYPHPNSVQTTVSGTKSGLSWDQVGTKLTIDNNTLKILVACKSEKSIAELMSIVGLKHRTKFRNKYVKPLLENSLIEMTIPDKPQSSQQRYLITDKGLTIVSEI